MREHKKGAILAATAGFVLIFTLLGLGSVYFAGLQNQVSEKQIFSTQGFWLAEAGIQNALWELNYGGQITGSWQTGWDNDAYGNKIYSGLLTSPPEDDKIGDYDITISSMDSPTPAIDANGYVNGVKRGIQVNILDHNFLSYALFGKDSLRLGGTFYVDSYDSRLGRYGPGNSGGINGDIGSNGNITIGGTPDVKGDAYAGVGDQILASGDYKITGEQGNLEADLVLNPVVVPVELLNLSSNGSLTSSTQLKSADYRFSSVNLGNTDIITISGPTNIYISGNLGMGSQSEIRVIAGPVKIYVDGNINMSGQGITNYTNVPANLAIYGTSTEARTITCVGNTNFSGIVYAPTANITLVGGGSKSDYCGAFVGKTIEKGSGTVNVHFDESLLWQGGPRYTPTSWREIY